MKETIQKHFAGNFKTFFEKYLTEIKKIGGCEYAALCPSPGHNDTSPSFNFSNQTGQFFCHGCGIKGDIFHFYAILNNLDVKSDFDKVLRGICDDFGIPWNPKRKKNREQRKIVKTYNYVNADNKLLFQAVRYDPKDFSQRQPDGKGGWIKNIKGVDRVLYRLPEVLKAKEVLIVEGEKDADFANKLLTKYLPKSDITATTCPMGAKKWKPEYSESLRDKNIVLLPDNDPEGREHMETVRDSLKNAAKSIVWLDLPNLPPKGDFSDWVQTCRDDKMKPGQVADDLMLQIQNTKPYFEKPKISTISLIEIASAEIEENPLIDGLVDEKESLIVSASSGVGKSLLVNQIALELGNPPVKGLWGIFPIPKQARTLIVQSELSFNSMNKRLKKLFDGNPEFKEGAQSVYTLKTESDIRFPGVLTESDFQNLLIEKLSEVNANLLILDPLISYHEEDENDSSGMRKALDCLTGVCDTANVSTIVVHHFNKKNESRGATAIRDWACNMLLLDVVERNQSSAILKITHDKSRNYEQHDDFYLERTPDLNFLSTDRPDSKKDQHIQAVVAVLEDLGGTVERQELLKNGVMKMLNCGKTTARNAINEALKKREIIVLPGSGKPGTPIGYRLSTPEDWRLKI